VGTGHLLPIAPPAEDIISRQREVKALVELRVPFELTRAAIDDVERGSDDSDWQPAKDAARKIAFAEDRAIFNGYPAANIQGIRETTSNPIMTSFTTICADQNNPQIDKSAETSGATGARSVGFMKNPFASSPTLRTRGPGGGSSDERGG